MERTRQDDNQTLEPLVRETQEAQNCLKTGAYEMAYEKLLNIEAELIRRELEQQKLEQQKKASHEPPQHA